MKGDKAYRTYMAQLVKAMAEGKTLSRSWLDIENPKADYDAQGVVDDVIERAGLVENEPS